MAARRPPDGAVSVRWHRGYRAPEPRRYALAVAYDPATDRLDGTASIRARATDRLCSFNLDLVGLEVTAITVDGRRAQWRREGQELIITPQRRLRTGRFDVAVRYGGVPAPFIIPGTDFVSGFIHTADGAVVIGQPESATAWFPVNDHPLDKARYSFDVTVPAGYEVVANGHLRSVTPREDGGTTWSWRATEPMASYLTTIDIGFWDVSEWRTERGVPVYDAVDSAITGALRAVIDADLARQGDILAFLSDTFGPYPFDTAGGIVDDDPRLVFALETQTRPVYSKLFWLDQDGNAEHNEGVVVHELAHQWFGDDLALARWQDIWLNEGFATYAEWLWLEHEGVATAAEVFRIVYDAIPADDPFWSVVIGDPGVELLFDGAVYDRGAMTLQALREEVGDETFFAILRGWAASRAGGNVTTPEFVAHAERVAGRQLDALFQTWLSTAGRPAPPAAAPSARAAGVDVRALLAAGHRHAKR